MKYETIIKVVCDAYDEDDAFHTAGEYLRGNIDSGVSMTFCTEKLEERR